MNDKFKEFKIKVEQSENAALIDSLIEHAKKSDENTDFYEAMKIVKYEILDRLEVRDKPQCPNCKGEESPYSVEKFSDTTWKCYECHTEWKP